MYLKYFPITALLGVLLIAAVVLMPPSIQLLVLFLSIVVAVVFLILDHENKGLYWRLMALGMAGIFLFILNLIFGEANTTLGLPTGDLYSIGLQWMGTAYLLLAVAIILIAAGHIIAWVLIQLVSPLLIAASSQKMPTTFFPFDETETRPRIEKADQILGINREVESGEGEEDIAGEYHEEHNFSPERGDQFNVQV